MWKPGDLFGGRLPAFLAVWVLGAVAFSAAPVLRAEPPFDLPPLRTDSPNFQSVYSNVRIGQSSPETESFRAGLEILNAVHAYLGPNSPVAGNTAYRDRLFVLLDHHSARWAANEGLEDIGLFWESAFAFALMRHHRPEEISTERLAAYTAGMRANITRIVDRNPLLYTDGVVANVWLNGDIRLAMGTYFGALALGDAATAEKARAAIDNTMVETVLQDGGTTYVGFWTESPTYHDESIRCLIFWWKLTGSASAKRALDQTLRYALVANEPSGFAEQSSSIAYKHMYNGRHSAASCLWKAYLYNDGYNYYYGRTVETATSTELLNAILYRPDRILMTPPAHIGVFFDGNIQGPRGRFDGEWGWIANGRDVQRGGPERPDLIAAQGYQGRQCGKNTFVGAFALGPVANKTPLKGAMDSVLVEFKETPGDETDLFRGEKFRYLSQDENTSTITRKNFATLGTTYRLSRRTSSLATTNWSASATDWTGQQLWVLTAERVIGLVQIVATAPATVYGLDARLVFTGGRRGIIGNYLELLRSEPGVFEFGALRAKVHAGTLTGPETSQRMATAIPGSGDDFSVLVRLHAPEVPEDVATEIPAGTRHWLVLDIVREGCGFASPVVNVLPGNANFAVLQFDESGREIRIVQNLRAGTHNYNGSFVVGAVYPSTSLHRSWDDTVDALPVTNGVAPVSGRMPPYSHMIAVSSAQADDHTNARLESPDIFGAAAHRADPLFYALGPRRAPSLHLDGSRVDLSFQQLRNDVDYVLQGSDDLSGWSDLSRNPFGPGEEGVWTDPLAEGRSKRFYRLRLQFPEGRGTP